MTPIVSLMLNCILSELVPNPFVNQDLHTCVSLLFQSAVGLELWSMSPDILFDNFIITNDKYVADQWAEQR